MLEARDILLGHAQLLEGKQVFAARVEQTHNALFAVHSGNGGHTEVDLEFVVAVGEAAVLRHAFFGNVHARKYLDTRYDACKRRRSEAHNLDEVAVYSHTHEDIVLERLDVNVGHLTDVRLLHEIVDQFDNGSVVDIGFYLVHLLGSVVGHYADGLDFRLLFAVEKLEVLVIAFDCAVDVFAGSQHYGSVHTRTHLDIFDDAHVLGVGNGDENFVVVNVQRHYAVAARKTLGDEFQHLGTLDDKVLFDERYIQSLRVSGEKLRIVDESARQQNVADVLVGMTLLPAESVAQLLVGDNPVCEQYFPDKMFFQTTPPC